METLYTAEAVVEGGRQGHGRTSDGRLDVELSVPVEMSGPGGPVPIRSSFSLSATPPAFNRRSWE